MMKIHFSIALCVAAGVTAVGAGAATIHRFAVTNATGSEGATAFVQSSATGSALQGEVASSPNTTLKIPFGVLGDYDASGSTFGIGVAGVSVSGYAIGAEAFGANPAVEVLAEGSGTGIEAATAAGSGGTAYAINAIAQGSGDGIDGNAYKGGWGGYFNSNDGIGVEGDSSGTGSGATSAAVVGYGFGSGPAGYFEAIGTGSALHALAETTSGAAVLGDDSIGSRGILGDSTGEGVVGFGHSGNDHAAITAIDAVGGTRLLETQAYNGGSPATSFIVQSNTANRSGDAVLAYSTDVQMSGDLYVYGKVFEDCSAFPAASSTTCQPISGGAMTTGAIAHSAGGSDVAMFTSKQSLPTVEDEGTAQLVGGKAYVRLDPAFARTMTMDRPYRVFVTPDGDSRGVFVSHRTPQGFEVNENQHGTSTLAFEYRIVGAPLGDRSIRFASVQKKTAAPALDPENAGLRAQAAEVRAFDLSRNRAAALRMQQRHTHPKVPVSFVTLSRKPAR